MRLRACVDAVREHAGDAFVDVERAREQSRRAVSGDGDDGGDDAGGETFEDMFDEEGKPRRGYVPKRGHTLPGMGGMSDAMGELRGVLKKVGVKTKTSRRRRREMNCRAAARRRTARLPRWRAVENDARRARTRCRRQRWKSRSGWLSSRRKTPRNAPLKRIINSRNRIPSSSS